MAQIQYEAKEIIVREGDPGYKAYVVVSGKVDLVRQVPQGETQVATMVPGMCFGEVSLLEPGTPYSTTARAIERSVLESITTTDLEEMLKQLTPTSSALVQTIIGRFRKAFVNREESETPAVQQGDVQKLVVSPGSDALARQFKDVTVSPTNLPFRIGGFPAENVLLKNRNNHLNLPSEGPPLTISRQHCEIALEGEGFYITDLGSRFCTVVNGSVIGRGRGKYQAPLAKGRNEVLLGGLTSPYKILVHCE